MALTQVSRGLLSTSIDDNGTSTAITIDSSENVGIGTSSPSRKLHVDSGAIDTVALFESSGDPYAYLIVKDSGSSGGAFFGANGTSTIIGTNGSTERMRIDSSGLVSIKNSTAPTLRIENTDTSLTANQTIGDIDFYQSDPSGTGVGVVSKIRSVNLSSFQGEAALTFHTGTASGLQEAMRMDSSGNVTTPYQPAFLVRPSSPQNNIPINAETTILFGGEVFDQGGNFASNTFTAPVTGRYQFNAAIYCLTVDSATAYVQLKLNTSNRLYYYIFSANTLSQDAFYMSFPLSVLVDMDAGDTAFLEFDLPNSGTAQMDVNSVSYFSGYLVA